MSDDNGEFFVFTPQCGNSAMQRTFEYVVVTEGQSNMTWRSSWLTRLAYRFMPHKMRTKLMMRQMSKRVGMG